MAEELVTFLCWHYTLCAAGRSFGMLSLGVGKHAEGRVPAEGGLGDQEEWGKQWGGHRAM